MVRPQSFLQSLPPTAYFSSPWPALPLPPQVNEKLDLHDETTQESATALGINDINPAHESATPREQAFALDTVMVADKTTSGTDPLVTTTPSSAPTTATTVLTITRRSSSMTAGASASLLERAGLETLTADDGAIISAAHSPCTSIIYRGQDDGDAVAVDSGHNVARHAVVVGRGILSTPAENHGSNEGVEDNASFANDHSFAPAASASVPVAAPSKPASAAADKAHHSRGGSIRRLPFKAPRKQSPSVSVIPLSSYGPPSMPLRVPCTSDPVVAALEPAFAAHLAQEAPAAGQRVRFSPESLWDYMCYCFGYGPNAALGQRAHNERKSALTYYVLRSDDDDLSGSDDGDGGDNAAFAGKGCSRDRSRSGNFESGGTGTLWLKARGRAPARPVVATDDIVATVMGVHRELGHANARSTAAAVAGAYFGIAKKDVRWVVARCLDCRYGVGAPPAAASSKQAGRRVSARKTAFAVASVHGNETSDSSDSDDVSIAGTKRKRA